ncbi:unnamed protein product [Cuscuta campestris]|uniref:CID domain-containing protein n=1 Tax=Cuscuta campestris TaxID=132261 RepID=A0A484LY72_9ASTE|nr:unnamed protein product [Cuscuta campestris]
MNSVFSEVILADKLSKLNNSQQCIETLSHWCIFHRSKAEQVAATWDKQFKSSEMVLKVPLLYLANDILQNSKRKGNEFVTEFWKFLPSAVKDLVENGDSSAKNVASRLVKIWEERKVFGSQAKSLNDVMLGNELPTPLQFHRKRSRSVKILKRDSRSIRTKLSIGGPAEKIVSALHLVLSEITNEEEEMSKCKSAVLRIRKIEKDVDTTLTTASDPNRKTLSKKLEEEENALKKCIEKLKVVEANRATLVCRLKETLNEQESELENVRTQIQVAQAQTEESRDMRRHLDDESYVADSKPSTTTAELSAKDGKKTAAAIAAEVADKLTASTSSQYIMSSVLSTFAAEAAKNAGHTNASPAAFPLTPPLPTPTINTANYSLPVSERPLPVIMPSQPANPPPPPPPYQSVLVLQHPTMQQQQSHHFHSLPPNPPPPMQTYIQQPSGGIVGSYGYPRIPSSSFLVPLAQPPPPPPPLQQHLTMPHQSPALQLPQHMPPLPTFNPLLHR